MLRLVVEMDVGGVACRTFFCTKGAGLIKGGELNELKFQDKFEKDTKQ